MEQKKEESKELAIKEVGTAMSVGAAGFLQGIGLETDDLQPGYLIMVQSNSKPLLDAGAKPGDIFDSLSSSPVAGPTKEIEVVPFSAIKSWNILDVSSQRPRKIRNVLHSVETALWKNGDTYVEELKDEFGNVRKVPAKRQQVLTWVCVLHDKAKQSEAMLYKVHFKGMSLPAGKKLATLVATAKMAGKEPFHRVYALKSLAAKNDKGDFFVFDVRAAGNVSDEARMVCEYWAKMVEVKPIAHAGDDIEEHD